MLAAASPFALAARPAGAAVNSDTRSGSLTFVTVAGATVNCTLEGYSARDTEGTRGGFAQNVTHFTGGPFNPACEGHQFIDASYKDSQGVTRAISTFSHATDEASVGWEGAYSAVKVTHRVRFNHCDATRSATCELSVNTAPK